MCNFIQYLQVFQNTSVGPGSWYLRFCCADKNTWIISSSIDGMGDQIDLKAIGLCPAAGQSCSNLDIKITCSTHYTC